MSTDRVKHEKFWFPDGNVVLSIPRIEKETPSQVGQGRGLSNAHGGQSQASAGKRRRTEDNSPTRETRVIFRVHKSILSMHSPVFQGMFALPEVASGSGIAGTSNLPGSLDETYEGAPVVELSDTEEQVVKLLGVFYDPLYVQFSLQSIHPQIDMLHYFSSLSFEPRDYVLHKRLLPLMEIADKYQVDTITTRIIKHIEADWPQTLIEWDRVEEQLKEVRNNSRNRSELRKKVLLEPVAAINFARRFQAKDILPAAFQVLLGTHYNDDWDDEGLRARIREGNRDAFELFVRTNRARWKLLSKEDYLLLGKMHDNVKIFVDMLFTWTSYNVIDQPNRQCSNQAHDSEQMKFLRADIRDCLRSARDVFGAVSEYNDEAGPRRRKFTFCKSCNEHIKNSLLFHIRHAIWKIIKHG